LSDLQGNATVGPLQTEFSTGSVIPRGAIRGVAFDWVAQRVASGARIEAMIGADTILKYLAAADTSGRFALANLPAGALLVRAYADQNGNRVLDGARESWDSATVALADSARRDFYLFAHDSAGPRPSNVTAVDSLTLRVKFDKPLDPSAPLAASQLVVRRAADSVRTPVRRVLRAAERDSLDAARTRAAADSAARADTTEAGRRARTRADSARAAAARDSIARAQMAALVAARDTVKREPPPAPARPAPLSEYVLELAAPLVSGTPMHLEVQDARGLSGASRTSQAVFVWRRPAVRDSTAAKAPEKKP